MDNFLCENIKYVLFGTPYERKKKNREKSQNDFSVHEIAKLGHKKSDVIKLPKTEWRCFSLMNKC